jgi:hypothetical protein
VKRAINVAAYLTCNSFAVGRATLWGWGTCYFGA